MIKNLGKLRQWTGERLGAAKVTLQTEDFQRLEEETERKRIGFEKVYSASEVAHGHIVKKKVLSEDGKTKVYPIEGLGICWSSHSSAFPEDSPLGAAMSQLGELECRVVKLQEELGSILKDDYMGTLEVGLHEYKEYLGLKKKLESRRLDYDAKSSRLQKAKKERPEWEQEMQASKLKYEETEYDLIQKMIYLQEYEDTHLEAIHRLLEAQYMYHHQTAEILDHMRSNWDQSIRTTTRHVPRTPLANERSPAASPASTPRSYQKDDYFSPEEPRSFQRQPSTRQGSTDNLGLPPRRIPSSTSVPSNGSEPRQTPPPMPRRQPQPQPQQQSPKRRKALYDFEGETLEELSFRTGDIITVVEEVDEGWWLGEVESVGPKRRGIFPVNYTEEIMSNRTPPTPAHPVIHEKPREEEQEKAYYSVPDEESPFMDRLPTRQPSPSGRPNMPSRSNSSPYQNSPSLSRSSTYVPLDTKPTTRTPPPPPTSRMSPSISSSIQRVPPPPQMSSSLSNTSRMAPQSHARILPAKSEVAYESDCQECGCNEFSPNVFKKGHCNNCFHKH